MPRASTTNICPTSSRSRRPSRCPFSTRSKPAGYAVSRINEADEKNPGVWGDSEMIYIDPNTGTLMGGQDQRHKFGKAAGY